MSGSNAIHGIILVGAMIVANEAHGASADHAGPGGGDPGHGQHRRWGRRDRPHAGDVQGPRPQRATAPTARGPSGPAERRAPRRLTASTVPNNALVGGYLVVRRSASSSPSRRSAPPGGPATGNLIGVGGMVDRGRPHPGRQHAGPYGIIPIGMVVGAVIGAPVVPPGPHDRHAPAGGRLQRRRRGGRGPGLDGDLPARPARPARRPARAGTRLRPGHRGGVVRRAAWSAFAKLQELLTGRPDHLPRSAGGQRRRRRSPSSGWGRGRSPTRTWSAFCSWVWWPWASAPASACRSAGPTRRC